MTCWRRGSAMDKYANHGKQATLLDFGLANDARRLACDLATIEITIRRSPESHLVILTITGAGGQSRS